LQSTIRQIQQPKYLYSWQTIVELRIGADIRKEKMEKMMELAERIKKVQEEVEVVLRKI